MKPICFCLALLFLFLTFLGCLSNRITKAYDFSGAQLIIDQKDLVVTATLIGASKPAEPPGDPNVTIRKSPYTLSFLLSSSTGYYREARVYGVWITDEKNRNLLLHTPEPVVGKFTETPAGNLASMQVKNLDLPFEKIFLTAELDVMTKANSIIKQTVQFAFDPSYSEEKTRD